MANNKVTKSAKNNIEVLSANGLSSFVDDTDGILKLKDVNGVVEPITNYTGNCNGEVIVQGTGTCSALRCGVNNTASGAFSSSLGGQNNCALGAFSVLVGGCGNIIEPPKSFISHGLGNAIFCNPNGCFLPEDKGGFIIGGNDNQITTSSCRDADFIVGGGSSQIVLPIQNGAGGNSIVNSPCSQVGFANNISSTDIVQSNGGNNITNSCYANIIHTIAGGCTLFNFRQIIGRNTINSSVSGCISTTDNTCSTNQGVTTLNNSITNSEYGRILYEAFGGGNIQPVQPHTIGLENNYITNSQNGLIQYNNNSSLLTFTGSSWSAYSSFNGIIGGRCNCINYCGSSLLGVIIGNTITQGDTNTISGYQASPDNPRQMRIQNNEIFGGASNSICGINTGDLIATRNTCLYSNSIFGGQGNYISASTDGLTLPSGVSVCNTIIGGLNNIVDNSCVNTIVGGCFNSISKQSTFSNITSGRNNCLFCTTMSFIGGGCSNAICGTSLISFSAVVNGVLNKVTAMGGAILGGCCNLVNGVYSSVSNGILNCSTACHTFIGGGCRNVTNAIRAVIVGGDSNIASGNPSGVGSGFLNSVTAPYTFIGGGGRNLASCNNSFIGAGFCNCATGCNTLVVGGCCNSASGYASTIIGGGLNSALGSFGVVNNGCSNQSSGAFTSVINGFGNSATASFAGVFGGQNNIASCVFSYIAGCGITSRMACALHANRLVLTNVPTSATGLPSGAVWSNAGVLSIVP